MKTSQRGITVMEILVAAAIFMLAFAALLNVLPASLVAERRSQVRVQADAIAQSVLEDALATPFQKLHDHPLPDVTVNSLVYHVESQVTSVDRFLKQINVTVTWDEPGYASSEAGKRTIALRSLVSNVRR